MSKGSCAIQGRVRKRTRLVIAGCTVAVVICFWPWIRVPESLGGLGLSRRDPVIGTVSYQ